MIIEDLFNMYDDVYYKKSLCEKCMNEKCGLRGKRIISFDKNNSCNNFIDKPEGERETKPPPKEDSQKYHIPFYGYLH